MQLTKGLELDYSFATLINTFAFMGVLSFFVGQWSFFFGYFPSPFWMGVFSFIYFGKVSSFQVVLGVSIIIGWLVRDLCN